MTFTTTPFLQMVQCRAWPPSSLYAAICRGIQPFQVKRASPPRERPARSYQRSRTWPAPSSALRWNGSCAR
eukprot:4666039-Alexandrium_andersonii.AAC.1